MVIIRVNGRIPPQWWRRMITEAELRQLLEAEGYTQEEIEYMAAMCFPYADLAAAVDEWVAMLQRLANYFESAKEVFSHLMDLGTLPPLPKKDPPRPPRYAGPQNKGRSWTRQPPRLARSSCRKMRR